MLQSASRMASQCLLLSQPLSALGSSRIVIFGGLAELIAGAISMGLGGWLAARGEAYSPLHSVSVFSLLFPTLETQDWSLDLIRC